MMLIRMLTLLLLLMLSLHSAASINSSVNPSTIQVGTSQIHVNFESPFTPAQKEKLLHWINVTANTMTTLYGEFPVQETHVHVYAKPNASEPVPWAEVWKNDAYKINFHVDPRFSEQAFLDDWTAPHEFSHLFHPYPGQGNAWFGEGLASYYQNILRARFGTLSEQEAFQKLYNGFQRGTKSQQRTRLSLKRASRNMRINHSYMHVYWGGAAYFLNVDVRLHQASGGKQSLDEVWLSFKHCCLNPEKYWPLQTLIPKLDELSGTTIFSDEHARIIDSPTFPDYQQSFEQLGIEVHNDIVTLSSTGSSQKRRQAITQTKN